VLRLGVRLAAVALVAAAAGLVVPMAAEASTCGTGSGVSVVVDFHELGGGAQSFCDVGGAGENAEQQLADAGFSVTLVDGEDFVCRIDDKPVTDCSRTPPANAYWSLWWSDGKSGEWKYSSVGGKSLKVPDGGYVGFSWQGQASQAKPRVTPGTPSSSAPTSAPTSHATARPSAGSQPSGSPVQAPATSTAPSDTGSSSTAAVAPTSRGGGHGKHRVGHVKKTASAGSSKAGSQRGQAGGPADLVAPASEDADPSSSGLPGWVAPVAIVVLFAGTGAVLLARRRSSGGG
jgi:hypothetical protein